MKKYSIAVCLFAVLFLNSCASEVLTTVKGYVKDPSGRPIAGAEVSLSSLASMTDAKAESGTALSGTDGFYTVVLRHKSGDPLHLTAKKRGFTLVHTQSFASAADVPKGNNDIVLR